MDLDNDELGRLERSETDQDVHHTHIAIGLGGGVPVAFDEISLAGRSALECALPEQVAQERTNIEADLRPQRLIIRFEDNPLGAAVQALLDVERKAADGDVLPL